MTIHVREGLHLWLSQEKVNTLRLINPFLSARSGINDCFVANTEDRLVFLFQAFRDVFNITKLAVKILELIKHVLIPKTLFFQVID